MKPQLILLTLFTALLISSPVLAQTAAQPADVVVLNDVQDKYPLGRHLEILKDPSGELTIQDVTSAAYQDQFILNQVDTPNFGFQKAAYWVRFRVSSQAKQNGNWVLELNFENMHYVDLYLPSPDSAGYEVKQSGVLRPYANRDNHFRNIAFNLVIPTGSEQTIYLRFQNDASMTLPLVLWEQDAFTSHMISDQLALGIFYGALLIMALYNFLLLYIIREKAYLYLLLFMSFLSIYFFFYDGIAYQFIHINSPKFAMMIVPLSVAAEIIFNIKFVDELLELKIQAPKIHRIGNFLVAAFLVILLTVLLDYKIAALAGNSLDIILLIGIFVLSLYYWRSGLRTAGYLLVSWIWVIIGGIFTLSIRLGILPSTPLTENLLRFGMVWMVAVWSLALADRVNTLKAKAETANRQLSESERRLAQFLEAMPVGVLVYDTDLKPNYINREARSLLGNPVIDVSPDLSMQRSKNEKLTRFSFQITGTEQPYPFEQLPILRALNGNSASADNIEIVLEGRHIPLEIWASPLLTSMGKVNGVLIAFRNISERLQKEALLLESETRYRTLVEIMNEGLGVADENDRFSYVNPRLAEMLGYSTDEMIGHPAVDFFDDEDRGLLVDQLARRRLGEKQPYTITWRRKDGSKLHTLIAPAAVFNPDGKFQRSIAVVTDISEQVKASQLLEQRVAERTHELSTLLEVSQVMVSTLDLEPLLKVILEELQSVIDFNGAAIISLEDRHLTTLNFPLKIKNETVEGLTHSISASLHSSERFRRDEAIIIGDVQADTPEGRDFRAIASTLIDAASVEMRAWMGIPLKVKEKLIGVLSVHHHQPDYYTPAMAQLAHAFANQAAVAIENARLYRQAQAAAAAEERGRLARELHDSVTQALYSLTLYAEATRLALGTGKAEAAEKNLSEVLAIAREGMGDLRLLIFELRPPVLEEEGLVGALQARLEAVEARAGCQAEFHVEGEPNLSPEVETELYWTVHEALNNVIKHARAKHVYVDLQFQNGTSKITIRDDGVGFDATNIERLSGIGFKNINERIKRIGGSFKIESQYGQGTFFEVKLAERK